jgi:hypothetical protein
MRQSINSPRHIRFDREPAALFSAPALQHCAIAMTVFPQGVKGHY